MPVRKRRRKDLRVSNLALVWVGFKLYHGSEGVNVEHSGGRLEASFVVLYVHRNHKAY